MPQASCLGFFIALSLNNIMAYASASDLMKRYDWRLLGDLSSDNDTRTGSGSMGADANIGAALDDASGMINQAVLAGERYEVDDLDGLTGVDQAILKRLTCDLAYGLLVMRRGHFDKKLPMYDEAQLTIQKLREGDRVFNVQKAKEAGNVQSEFVSLVDYATINLARDYCFRFFPVRREQRSP